MSFRSSNPRRQTSRVRSLDSASTGYGQRRLRFEPLEDRRLLAELHMMFAFFEVDVDGGRGPEMVAPTPTITMDSDFLVELQVRDNRAPEAPGVIALPVTVTWNGDLAKYIGEIPIPRPDPLSDRVGPGNPLVTPSFPEQRFVDTDGSEGTFLNLRGGALPNAGVGAAIGTDVFDPFSQMKFHADKIGTVCFDATLVGSMSFADAAMLENNPTAKRCIVIIDEPKVSSLSGFVYLDANSNGRRDVDLNNQSPELGLPNVIINLYLGSDKSPLQTVDTGPGGWYHFENLAAGTYRIEQVQPTGFLDGEESLGIVLPDGQPRGTVGNDVFSNIELDLGEHGIDYNFGERIDNINKRMFLASTPSPREIVGARQGILTKVIEVTSPNTTVESKLDTQAFEVTSNGSTQTIPFSEARIVSIDARQGNNTVTVVGTAASDAAYSTPGYAILRRDDVRIEQGYGMEVTGAKTVVIDAGGDGQNDRIVMQDSPRNDQFVAGDTNATNPPPLVPTRTASLTANDTGMRVLARRFQQVRAVSSAGGTDQAIEQAHDMVLTRIGNWQP